MPEAQRFGRRFQSRASTTETDCFVFQDFFVKQVY